MSRRGQIDDRQSAMRKADASVGVPPDAIVVGSAMGNAGRHSCERSFVDSPPSEDSGDPAHGQAALRSAITRMSVHRP
jgi:hypothetical protein